jgi:hypothetical protein
MWSDRETSQDCLGYKSYVDVLAHVCTHKDLAPLTLGVFGPWGSGKTSLMQMLMKQIESIAGEKKRKTLWFNAWMYEGREEAQSALIHAILGKLHEEVSIGGEVKQLWDKLKNDASILKLGSFIMKSAVTLTPDIDGFVDAFKDESGRIADTMESFEGDLRKLLELVHIDRIVVFIDDLDRCSSAKVIETFETIKLFLNTPACTFVIGADAEKIKQAVGEVYSVTDAKRQKDYLEKIVQIPFSIPAQDLRDIGCYVGMLIVGRHLGEKAWQALSDARPAFYSQAANLEAVFRTWVRENKFALGEAADEVEGELESVLPYVDVLARGLRGNPRQIKRFLNILSLRHQLAKANKLDAKPNLLLKFAVIEYVWDEFFTALAETVDPKTGTSGLLEQLASAAAGTKGEEPSEIVAQYLKEPGLTDFLAAPPALDGTTKLEPYLFLAQTSLSRSQTVGIVTIDEKTKQLVKTIQGADAVLSRSAARRAAEDSTVAAAVARQLAADLSNAKDPVSIANMLGGLESIARIHPDLFKLAAKPLADVDGANPAVALAASTLIIAAKKAGTEIPKAAEEKFTKSSRIAEALSKPRSGPARRGQ